MTPARALPVRPRHTVGINPVDLALILAVDGSASVTYDEFNLIESSSSLGC